MNWSEWDEVAKNESLWRGHQEKGLLKAEYVRDYVLRLWFEDDLDVSIYELDFYPLMVEDDPGEVFLPLRNNERFRLVAGDYALIWLNPETGTYDEKAVDIAPECVRFFCERYGKKLKVSGREPISRKEAVKRVKAFSNRKEKLIAAIRKGTPG